MEEMRTNSGRLRKVIALMSGGLSARIRDLWMHPRLSDVYPEFLFGLYGVVVASTPLLRHASFEAERLSARDPLARKLASYLLEHADEESGHEEWLLNDLHSLGFGKDRVIKRLPYGSVASLVGGQYYLASHLHPVAILGYLAVLENPGAPEFFEYVARRSELSLASMSTLIRHAQLDVGHVAEFDGMLDELDLTERDRDIMTMSAISSVRHLELFFEEVMEHFSRIDDPKRMSTIFHRNDKAAVAFESEEFPEDGIHSHLVVI